MPFKINAYKCEVAMSLSDDDLTKTANLARLHLPLADNDQQGKRKKLASDLNNIIKLVTQIESVDTNNVSPMAHSFDNSTFLAEDKAIEPNMRDRLQELVNPDNKEAGLYLVPQVIE
ncbi:MAG: Asp-tRNA(Asn)/Glu-tRNA(Gln) amidotransferase subunit GatC [Francisellaceae bacterium]|nr:Asp-tRNA(Asn)/Glu-tRNA(Gln) amidotransferase subunit GatC [Francisellaceae bacterium]MBT6207096.1 Asp-tRNA(Asn)/Glu-tRNA(Gln) amidotransferase subunit GatC [Francisellaceae bacterium]MBT6539751.1 Asp-tRNA(Asn)/Glu-tRNA(Gln) amidotransferase subunit GatC [Francisellaceae bacterium]